MSAVRGAYLLGLAVLLGCSSNEVSAAGATDAMTDTVREDVAMPADTTSAETASADTAIVDAPPDTTAAETGSADTADVARDATEDAGPSGPPIMVACGMSSCNVAIQVCCVTTGGSTCLPKGETCGGAVVACSDSAACGASESCCTTEGTPGTTCRASCSSGETTLCSPFLGDCPSGKACTGTMPGPSGAVYRTCE